MAAALPRFVAALPEPDHRSAVESVVARFEVVPLGLDLARLADRPRRPVPHRPPVILWPHRWEADKDPAAFGRALAKLEEAGIDFTLALAGEDPGAGSDDALAARRAVIERFRHRLMAVGPFERADYEWLLGESDLIVSCAHHDFFGAAVVGGGGGWSGPGPA